MHREGGGHRVHEGKPVKRCHKGDLVSVTGEIWYVKTPDDLRVERERDVAAGRYHDDGGEPILYSPYASVKVAWLLLHTTTARVDWKYWYKKPANLREGVDLSTGKTYLFRTVDITQNVTTGQ